MSATRHPPFDATLRPTSKSRGAVLAALTMAPLDFEVGFGNIFLLSTMEFHNGKSQVWRNSLSAMVFHYPMSFHLHTLLHGFP